VDIHPCPEGEDERGVPTEDGQLPDEEPALTALSCRTTVPGMGGHGHLALTALTRLHGRVGDGGCMMEGVEATVGGGSCQHDALLAHQRHFHYSLLISIPYANCGSVPSVGVARRPPCLSVADRGRVGRWPRGRSKARPTRWPGGGAPNNNRHGNYRNDVACQLLTTGSVAL